MRTSQGTDQNCKPAFYFDSSMKISMVFVKPKTLKRLLKTNTKLEICFQFIDLGLIL